MSYNFRKTCLKLINISNQISVDSMEIQNFSLYRRIYPSRHLEIRESIKIRENDLMVDFCSSGRDCKLCTLTGAFFHRPECWLRFRLYYSVVFTVNPCSHEWPRYNFFIQYQYNIEQTSDKNKEKYQLIQYQNLRTNIIRIVGHAVRRLLMRSCSERANTVSFLSLT